MTTGYGSDVSCADSLVTGRVVRGHRLVAEALFRRVNTERGTLQGLIVFDDEGNVSFTAEDEESAYGLDLPGYIGAVADDAVAAIPALVRGEWMKDDRVADVDLVATSTTNSAGEVEIVITSTVTLVDEGGAFNLTIAATSDDIRIALLEAA